MLDYIVSLNKFDIDRKNSLMQSALNLSLINENFNISERLITLNAKVTSNDKRISYEVKYI